MRKIASIKLKVLILMILIPGIITGGFFVMAQKSIIAEKKTQALERGISENESLNSKLVHALEMVEQTAKLIIKAQKISTSDSTEILSEIFYAQENLLGLYLYQNNDNTLKALLMMEKPAIGGLVRPMEEKIAKLRPLEKIIQVERLGENEENQEKPQEEFIFYYLNLPGEGQNPIYALLVFSAAAFKQSFTISRPWESYLMDLNGKILMTNTEKEESSPGFSTWSFFQEITQQKLSVGTKIERDYLVSFAKFDGGNYLISMIPQAEAFVMARILQKNFILIALAFLSLAPILGIIFANGITHKLKILAWHSEQL